MQNTEPLQAVPPPLVPRGPPEERVFCYDGRRLVLRMLREPGLASGLAVVEYRGDGLSLGLEDVFAGACGYGLNDSTAKRLDR